MWLKGVGVGKGGGKVGRGSERKGEKWGGEVRKDKSALSF